MKLEGMRILIISPEAWGVNMLSKHHYAIELAKQNNQVYFLNPSRKGQEKITLTQNDRYPNITEIDYTSRLRGSSRLPSFITDMQARIDIKKIRKAINAPLDIVWNFDMYRYQNPKFFQASVSILHPVDYIDSPLELRAAKLYDYIFSVSADILEKFKSLGKPTFFINHGISEYFVQAIQQTRISTGNSITCGYVGNLLSIGIHYENLLTIVRENENVQFHFIGPYTSSNLGTFETSESFLKKLTACKNVTLHGAMHPRDVALTIQQYDMFLIAYHPEKVGKMASNNHKILEYLSTGKVVVSSRISSYDKLADGLFEMVASSDDLPARFKNTLAQLEKLNTDNLQHKRKKFATDNTYRKQLERIEVILANPKA